MMEYYSAIKKDEMLSFAKTWVDLEDIVLSEVRQRKTILYIITYRVNLKKKMNQYNKKKQTYGYRKQTSSYQWGERRRRGKIGVED